jgi:hypothetical protein
VDRGAIAIVDALGFKGIWGAADATTAAILGTLKKIGAAAREEADDAAKNFAPRKLPPLIGKLLKDPFVKVVQLSDTIVVAAGYRPRVRSLRKTDHEKWDREYGLGPAMVQDVFDTWLRHVVCACVCSIMKTAALCDPALVYRGVVTVGRFAIDENFILGPAVDEAAELMDLADGAFVWLAPSAMRVGKIEPDDDPEWSRMTFRYPVPLKDGRGIRTRVLSPFADCDPEERKKVQRRILRRMNDSRLDVVIKRNNTARFLESITGLERLRARAGERKSKGTGETGQNDG